MRKAAFLTLLVICLCAAAYFVQPTSGANVTILGGGSSSSSSSGGDYSDIIFYWSCNSTTADKSAGDTSAAAQVNAVIDSVLYQVGTGSCDLPTSYSRFDFTLNNDDLIDVDAGRIGFFVRVDTAGTNAVLFRAYYNANNYLKLAIWDADQIFMEYYSGGSGMQYEDCTACISTGSFYFVEFRFNKGGAGNDFQMFINGSSVLAVDTASGTWTKSASGVLSIGDTEGNGADFHIDQVIISNNPDRDLYALRNTTSF